MIGPLEIADLNADPQGRVLKQESLDDIRAAVQSFVDAQMPILLSLVDGGPVDNPADGYSQTDSSPNTGSITPKELGFRNFIRTTQLEKTIPTKSPIMVANI